VGWAWQFLSATSGILAVALPILNWSKKLSDIADLHGRWIQIRNEHEMLWRRMESGIVSQPDATVTFQSIEIKECDSEHDEKVFPNRRSSQVVGPLEVSRIGEAVGVLNGSWFFLIEGR
jgi:hypothetical protein